MITPSNPTPDVPKPHLQRAVSVLLVVAAVLGAVATGVGVGPGLGQATSESADLAVDQPHYVNSDVSRRSANGTTVYEVRGEEIELYPQNFAADRVVGFGTTTGNGSLDYERDTGGFVLSASETGTYELYFIVEETVVVDGGGDDTSGNQTGNATDTGTETATRERRYEARVRVTGGLNLVHRSAGSIEDQRTAAENWEEFNSTLQQRDLMSASGVEQTVEEMIAWYELRKHPQEALTGGVVATLIILFTTVGGLIVAVFVLGYHVKAMDWFRKELQKREALKAEEGTAKDAVADLTNLREQQALQNLTPQDLPGFDDLDASAWQDTFGETLHDSWVEFLAVTQPRHLVADRLRAMGGEGWVAVVDERTADTGPDVASDGGGAIARVHLAHRDDIEDVPPEDVIDLGEADERQIATVRDALESWDSDPLSEFDLTEADIDTTGADITAASMDLEALVDNIEMDMRYFDDEMAFGEHLHEFVASVEDSPECDTDGRPEDVRWTMSHFLKLAQRFDQRHNYPLARYWREAIETALIDFDAAEQAKQTVDDIELGVDHDRESGGQSTETDGFRGPSTGD